MPRRISRVIQDSSTSPSNSQSVPARRSPRAQNAGGSTPKPGSKLSNSKPSRSRLSTISKSSTQKRKLEVKKQPPGASPTRHDRRSAGSAASLSAPRTLPPVPKSPKVSNSPAAPNKQSRLIELLHRPDGASLADLMQATGWQAHSIRGAISAVLRKRLGLIVACQTDQEGRRIYRIVPSTDAAAFDAGVAAGAH